MFNHERSRSPDVHRAQPIWTWNNQCGSVLAVNSYDQSTGAVSGTYNVTNSCDEAAPQGMTGWLAQTNSGAAISFTVNFGGCGSTTVWTGQLNAASGCQGLWPRSPSPWYGMGSVTALTLSRSAAATSRN
nr:avidin/streptavidin family protein [Bradyrhizobium diazoefficiens]